ncbi:hypothetical protein [Streptomyces mangrovisoli]|uniref:Uncharacterized protein n=1 Tax=Streptomyces mangrovisoli TaxID=1428628 RepID=A0A1J4P174_9ACTN|nr:hypothetical protein [Streptomyces mangrovisoli]OIJ68344.1 hypothetical protein WN71_007945 [Streptomyces mangrovisoli]
MTAVLAAVGVVCALVLCVLWQLHRAVDRTPPDVGAFAHSATTRTAGAAAARTSSARLTKLTSALPWAVPLGTSVADSCQTEDRNPFLGSASWAPINCARSTVLYLAFDGDIRTRLHQLDAVLAQQRWVGSGSSPNTLTGMATWLSQAGGDPSPAASERGSTEPPGSRPICLSTTYGPAAQKHAVAHGGLGVGLHVAVAEPPCTPDARTGDIQTAGGPEKYAVPGTVYLTWHPLSTKTVSRCAYTAHRYVAAFSLVDGYAVQSTATTSSASPLTG